MNHLKPRLAVLLMLATASLVLSTGCGKDEPDTPAAAIDATGEAGTPEPPPHPKTDDGLIEAFTVAMEKRDLKRMKTLVAAELAAELHRWHDKDAEAFWGRGQRWITNVRSGYEIAFTQDGKDTHRRALLKFENGQEETVIFTTVDGKVLLAEL